ncbi:creatininase family protein [Arundinibacter roseus]|uniref:Creatininase family protein n=1 Tax=Arundinibacter roseus TaxID=2070510 RepID=A0A4R4KBL4_9BACT|nr:creatininase family protein [Arundinibacter roseus]TDB64076.1 creatininase family protein [Arundinibacter roseus]
MRPYILAETNWKALKNQTIDLVILPWGATEAHNYHLPYATDVIEADHIAAESARIAWEAGAKVMVLPTIPFGVNSGQTDILLDINMHPSTQLAVLNDIVEVLNRQGIYKLLVLNSHGGNDFKPILRELGVRFPSMHLSLCFWFSVLDRSQYFEEKGDHADEVETSLMMHLRPDLVRPLEEAGDGSAKVHTVEAFREGWAWTERKWSQVTEDTGIGNPKKSSAPKGERFFMDLTQKLGQFFVELAQADPKAMYE